MRGNDERTRHQPPSRWGLLAGGGVLLLVAFSMGQASRPSAALEERVTALERAVARLERRVAALERARPSAAGLKPGQKKGRDASAWSRLRKGMTADQVRELLGEPDEVRASPWGMTTWKYGPVAWVAFDENMRVTRWFAP